MRFRVRSYEDIRKIGIYIKGSKSRTSFVSIMRAYCGKVFEFYEPDKDDFFYQKEKGWFIFVKPPCYAWHISWLIPLVKNKQYLLEFE